MKSLRYAFIQSGYCVFGVGYTKRQAISDARKWLEDENGKMGGLSWQQTAQLLEGAPVYGGFRLLNSTDEEFDSYMKNQGCFRQSKSGRWYK